MIADAVENADEKIPSKDKIRNNVMSVLKVFNTHFKLHTFEMDAIESRTSIAQWKNWGNMMCEATEA